MPGMRRFTPGQILKNSLKIVATLNVTNMSRIYIAEDIRTGLRLIVKHPNYEDTPKKNIIKTKSLKIEADILKKLDHPNIVKIIDYETKPWDHLVLKFIKGNSLLELQTQSRLELTYVKEYIIELLEILEYLHTKGIIHGDITPRNFLCGDSLTIIDFGLAQDTSIVHKSKYYKMGTSGYICPEADSGIITPLCDIYSAGAILFFLLTGYKPTISNKQIRLNDKRKTSLQIALDAMKTNPRKRIKSANEMKQLIIKAIPNEIGPYLFTKGVVYGIGDNPMTIGMRTYNDICIDDPYNFISPVHSEITKDPSGDIWIEDRSKNGTFVFDETYRYTRIKKRRLKDGDTIILCHSPKSGSYKRLKIRYA